MSTLNFNNLLAEVDKSKPAPLPAGTYDTVCESATATSTQGGKPMVKATFKVITGPHAGRKIFDNFVISAESAGALSYFFQDMEILGLNRDFFAANPPLENVAAAITGKQCKIAGELGEWQGRARFEANKLLPPTPGLVAQVTPQAAAPVPQAAAVPAPAPPPAPAPAPAPVPQAAAPAPAPQAVPDPGF